MGREDRRRVPERIVCFPLERRASTARSRRRIDDLATGHRRLLIDKREARPDVREDGAVRALESARATRQLARLRDRARLRPGDRLSGHLDACVDAHIRGETGHFEGEIAAPHERRDRFVGVDRERVEDEAHVAPGARAAGGRHEVPARAAADRGEARLHARAHGDDVVHHDPLVPLEERDLLLSGAALKARKSKPSGSSRIARARRSIRRAARGPASVDRWSEAGGARAIGRVDEVRPTRGAGRADADGVGADAATAVGALVDERHLLERRRGGGPRSDVAEDVDGLVEHRPVAEEGEPRRDRRHGPPGGRVGVPGQHDARARQVGREIAGAPHAERRVLLAVSISRSIAAGAISTASLRPRAKEALTKTVTRSVPPLRQSKVPPATAFNATTSIG